MKPKGANETSAPVLDPTDQVSRDLETELRGFAQELPDMLASLAWDSIRLEKRILQVLSSTPNANLAYVYGYIKALIVEAQSIPRH